MSGEIAFVAEWHVAAEGGKPSTIARAARDADQQADEVSAFLQEWE